MSKANGKVRPGWMGGSSDSYAGTTGEEQTDTPAPPEQPEVNQEEVHTENQQEEAAAGAGQVGVQADPETPEENVEPSTEPSTRPDPTERIEAPAGGADEPVQHNATSSHSTYSAAPSFGKKNSGVEARQQTAYPGSDSAAPSTGTPERMPTGIKAAISSFVERISGKRQSVPGMGQEAGSAKTESPEQVETELKPSLRETTIEGFRRIAFGSHEGGVGKSSLAYIVAGAIADCTNLRVCLVDADPNFGSTRYLVPRPVEQSVLDLADDAERLERLADLRTYVSQNEQMGLDILLNPVYAAQISEVPDLAEAYEKVDAVLSRFYDLVVYDLGVGFRDEAIRGVLGLSDELVLVSDAEVIPNAQLTDALRYVEGLGVNLGKTTLAINHGRPPEHESALTTEVRKEYENHVRHVTEVPYDAALSQLLNTRAFHVEKLAQPARLGVLTTASAALEGLRRDAWTDGYEKVLAMQRTLYADQTNGVQKGGR